MRVMLELYAGGHKILSALFCSPLGSRFSVFDRCPNLSIPHAPAFRLPAACATTIGRAVASV